MTTEDRLFRPITAGSLAGGRHAFIWQHAPAPSDAAAAPHRSGEIWQANAGGRYDHSGDQHDAPLDPNSRGGGGIFSDLDGWYQFNTVKPGAYPWRKRYNAWRPKDIHYSLFGTSFVQRVIIRMYFPGDPLLALDPIYLAVPDQGARERLVARFDIDITSPSKATPIEDS